MAEAAVVQLIAQQRLGRRDIARAEALVGIRVDPQRAQRQNHHGEALRGIRPEGDIIAVFIHLFLNKVQPRVNGLLHLFVVAVRRQGLQRH